MRSGALAALGSERRAGPGPARPGGVRAVGQRRSRSRRVRAFGLSGEEAARAPVRPRGRPGAASPRPGGALRSEIPPVRALRAAGGRGGGAADPPAARRPQLAARRCDANWRPFRRCPRSGLSELSASARGETGVCLFRSGRKKSQANQWACRCRAEPACFFRPRNGERYGSRKALPLRFPLRTSSPRPAAAERPAGPESRRAGAERGRCGSRERRFGGAGGQWLSTAVPVLRARGSGASAGN